MIQIVNTQVAPWPTKLMVLVQNNNPFPNAPMRFDGKDYDFPPGEAVMVSPEAAFFLFAVETRYPNPQITRDKLYGKQHNNDVSYYDECMLRLGCANSAEGRQWFANFDFELIPMDKRFTKRTFEELRKQRMAAQPQPALN